MSKLPYNNQANQAQKKQRQMPTLQEYQQFFAQKQQIESISTIKPLRNFIEEYPDESLIPKFIELQKHYKYYRAISGDGNCFYRAIMFQYLRVAPLNHFQVLFPQADLMVCEKLPFRLPRGFDSDCVLRYIWEKYLLPLDKKRPEEREKQLEGMLNQSKNLDAALVGYLRALNYNYLSNNRQQYEQFSDGNLSNDLNRIKTFGKQSEGVELYTLATVLKAVLTVIMVHPDSYVQFNINSDPSYEFHFIVSYRPGHYDIPITRAQASVSQNVEIRSAQTKTLRGSVMRTVFERKSCPEVVVITNPSDVRRLTTINSDNKSDNHQKVVTKRGPPQNMKSFRQSRHSNQTIQEQASTTKQQRQPEVKQTVTKVKPKLPRTSLIQQKEQDRKQRVVCESIFCTFGVLTLVLALFIL